MPYPIAFQLHYRFQFPRSRDHHQHAIRAVLRETCDRHNVRILEGAVIEHEIDLTLSLRPDQAPSKILRLLRGNLARRLPGSRRKGSRLVSSGKATYKEISAYIAGQADHHGVRPSDTYAWQNPRVAPGLSGRSHGVHDIRYHVVLASPNRVPVFHAVRAPALPDAMRARVDARCELLHLTMLPDHLHILVLGIPTMAPVDLLGGLARAVREVMPGEPIRWLEQLSYLPSTQDGGYVGTTGEVSTAALRKIQSAARARQELVEP